MTTSWNKLQDTDHGLRQSVITKKALGTAGTEEAGVPKEPKLTSLS